MAITKQTSARVQVQQNALDAAARDGRANRIVFCGLTGGARHGEERRNGEGDGNGGPRCGLHAGCVTSK